MLLELCVFVVLPVELNPLWMARVHAIKSLFSLPLPLMCGLKAVKNMVAMVSVPSPPCFTSLPFSPVHPLSTSCPEFPKAPPPSVAAA